MNIKGQVKGQGQIFDAQQSLWWPRLTKCNSRQLSLMLEQNMTIAPLYLSEIKKLCKMFGKLHIDATLCWTSLEESHHLWHPFLV